MVVAARESAQDVTGVRVALSKLVRAGVTPADDGTLAAPATSDHTPSHARPRPPSTPEARVVAGVAGRSTAIELTLAADYGTDLVALGERIRDHVADRVRDLTGLEPVTVTVHIDDVFE